MGPDQIAERSRHASSGRAGPSERHRSRYRNIGLEIISPLRKAGLGSRTWSKGLLGAIRARHRVRQGFDPADYDWDVIARRTLKLLDALPGDGIHIIGVERSAPDV